MTFAEGFVYVSKNIRNEIVIFNVDGRKILDGRQEALEYDEAWHIEGDLHEALHSKVAKKYNFDGIFLSQRSFPFVVFFFPDGIVLDAAVITSHHNPSTVAVFYNHGGTIQHYHGIQSAADADITYMPNRRPTLILVDSGSSQIRMYAG